MSDETKERRQPHSHPDLMEQIREVRHETGNIKHQLDIITRMKETSDQDVIRRHAENQVRSEKQEVSMEKQSVALFGDGKGYPGLVECNRIQRRGLDINNRIMWVLGSAALVYIVNSIGAWMHP